MKLAIGPSCRFVSLQTHNRPEYLEGPNKSRMTLPAGSNSNLTSSLYHAGIAVKRLPPHARLVYDYAGGRGRSLALTAPRR